MDSDSDARDRERERERDPAVAQQRFLSLFLHSEREIFRCVAALLPNVADAEDLVQQAALALLERFDSHEPNPWFTPSGTESSPGFAAQLVSPPRIPCNP